MVFAVKIWERTTVKKHHDNCRMDVESTCYFILRVQPNGGALPCFAVVVVVLLLVVVVVAVAVAVAVVMVGVDDDEYDEYDDDDDDDVSDVAATVDVALAAVVGCSLHSCIQGQSTRT